MVMIQGLSGHGKSNFALALAYALGYCQKPSTELMTWDWEGRWGVFLSLLTNNTDLQVERGSKFGLRIDGENITGSAASKSDRLTKAIGLEPGLLGPLTYRPQRTFGLFLSMPDEDKKEILSKLLGLDQFENAADEAAKKLPDLERAVQNLDAQVQASEREIEYLKNQHQTLEDEAPAEKAADEAKDALDIERGHHGAAATDLQEWVTETTSLEHAAYDAALKEVRA